jgi:hypothetical protein
MPTPEGEITSTEIWSQPVEEKQDDLSDVQGSSESEPTGKDKGSKETTQEV